MIDRDIWLSANLMIKQYRDFAEIEVAMRADEMLEKSDLDGRDIWLRVLTAVRALTVETAVGSMH